MTRQQAFSLLPPIALGIAGAILVLAVYAASFLVRV